MIGPVANFSEVKKGEYFILYEGNRNTLYKRIQPIDNGELYINAIVENSEYFGQEGDLVGFMPDQLVLIIRSKSAVISEEDE